MTTKGKAKFETLSTHDPHHDHYVINPVSRKFAETFIDEDALQHLDEAKREIAERVGVREEHIRLKIQMLVLAEI